MQVLSANGLATQSTGGGKQIPCHKQRERKRPFYKSLCLGLLAQFYIAKTIFCIVDPLLIDRNM